MRFTFTQDDILRGTIVAPSWYPVEVFEVEDVTASTGANGTKISVRVLGDKFTGVPVSVTYYENAPGFSKKFIEALGAKVEAGKSFDLDDKLKGKKLRAYIKNGLSNKNNAFNEISDWQPAAA